MKVFGLRLSAVEQNAFPFPARRGFQTTFPAVVITTSYSLIGKLQLIRRNWNHSSAESGTWRSARIRSEWWPRIIHEALSVSADELIFDENERGPQDDLRLQFEAVSKFTAEEKKVIKSVLEGLILKHEAKRWSSAS